MMMQRTFSTIAVAAAMACSAEAQNIVSMASGPSEMAATFRGPRFAGPVITGAPYSGEQVTEHTQTLSDGTHIVQPSQGRQTMYRDSAGRTRTERPFMRMPGADSSGVTLIEISDPVAGYAYTLDTVNKIAHRVKLPAPGATRVLPLAGGASGRGIAAGGGVIGSVPASGEISAARTAMTPAPPGANAARPEMKSESLGTQIIEGLPAEGRKTTMTWPIGSQGNDRPLVSASEVWTSTELRLMVLSKHDDPRNGETITKLTNISRAEPDPSLFQPPPDYNLVDEEGEYTIRIARP